eukprot:1004770-Amphidinium_carterae.1
MATTSLFEGWAGSSELHAEAVPPEAQNYHRVLDYSSNFLCEMVQAKFVELGSRLDMMETHLGQTLAGKPSLAVQNFYRIPFP